MLRKLIPVVFFMTYGSVQAQMDMSSTEISAVSGFYNSEKTKKDGSDNGGMSTISLGGRFHQFLSEDQQWFLESSLALTSWDAPSGMKAPSNATSIRVLGGIRQFFTEFSQVVIPYAAVYGGYQSIKTGSVGVEATENEKSGLYYFGAVGFRMDVAAETFFELECELFESALFGTETTKTGGTKSETSSTDLSVDTSNGVSGNLTIALGMEI